MDNREPGCLSEGDDERLLPVRHKAGVHIGLNHDCIELPARMPEANSVVEHIKLPAGLTESVEEGNHRLLLGTTHENIAPGGQRRRFVGVNAVGQSGVMKAVEFLHAFNPDGAVRIERNHRAHFLQDVNEVLDLRLHRRIGKNRDAVRHYRRQ